VTQGGRDSLKVRKKMKKRRGTTVVQVWLEDGVSCGQKQVKKEMAVFLRKEVQLILQPRT